MVSGSSPRCTLLPFARGVASRGLVAGWLPLGVTLAVSAGVLAGCDRQCPDTTPPGPQAEKTVDDASEARPPLEDDRIADGDEAQVAPPPVSEAPVAPELNPDDLPVLRRAITPLTKWAGAHGGRVYAHVADLEEGKALLSNRATQPVNPASNMKLVTAAVALDRLGPARTFATELFGEIDQAGTCSRLVLRGGGSPDLTTSDLERLLRVVRGRGLKKVEALVVDQSRFAAAFVPPAFDQQPGEWAAFRAPVSALAVDRNTVALNVVATVPGEPAHVWYEPPGVVVPGGRVMTAEVGAGDHVQWSMKVEPDPAHMKSVVGGTIGAGLDRRRYHRRLADPRLAGGYALRALLSEQGVEVPDQVQLGEAGKLSRIAYLPSAPLSELIRPLGKESDNFTAEMLFVDLSAVDDRPADEPWSFRRGAALVESWLAEGNVGLEGIEIQNGSGLFDANRLTTQLLVHVLARMEQRPEVFAEFLSQLAILGTDGTLKRRGRDDEFRGRIRAKTGTLHGVNALSGYILRGKGGRPVAFSLIVEGVDGRHGEARGLMDGAVSSWAAALLD